LLPSIGRLVGGGVGGSPQSGERRAALAKARPEEI